MALPFLRWLGGRAVRAIDGTLTAWPYAFLAYQALRIWATGADEGTALLVRVMPALLVYEFFLTFHDFLGGAILRAKSRFVRLAGFVVSSALQGGVALMIADMAGAPEVIHWFLFMVPWRLWSVIARDELGYWSTLGAVRILAFLLTAPPIFLYYRGRLPRWGLSGHDIDVLSTAMKGVNADPTDVLYWVAAYCLMVAPFFFLASFAGKKAPEEQPEKGSLAPVYAGLACLVPLIVESIVVDERVSVWTTVLSLATIPTFFAVSMVLTALKRKGA